MKTTIFDRRYIEVGFPCHQVGAETRRERGASSALPPLYYLHVWWARRPLTPSRAAILASLLPANTDADWFLRELGIEKTQALINGVPWTLLGTVLDRVKFSDARSPELLVDRFVLNRLDKEEERRYKNRNFIGLLTSKDETLVENPILIRWLKDSQPLPKPWPGIGDRLPVQKTAADPAHVNERLQFRDSLAATGLNDFRWDEEDLYGYGRAFMNVPPQGLGPAIVLDPSAGGGSIPFESLRLGLKSIANDLNPVASVILSATLRYPLVHGPSLGDYIEKWGAVLLRATDEHIGAFFPESKLRSEIVGRNWTLLGGDPELSNTFGKEHILDYLYARQVTCPHCGGDAPLLNSSWLSKSGEQWGVRIIPDRQSKKVRFEPYRVRKGRGPGGEDPNFATVNRGNGRCVHCRQAITADEIKAQARGESVHGKWRDVLYCVVAIRYEPKLDKNGEVRRYKTGARAGEIVTQKIRFFRAPNQTDLAALKAAEDRLNSRWAELDRAGLIPTENIPKGYNTAQPLAVGIFRWCDMFTPRQLLGHLTMVEELNKLKPQIIEELGFEKARAIITYLQFVIDKGVDYNSRQTRWEYTRGIVKGTFGRHDFWPKWTFGEMVFAGPNSGARWALSQIVDAYKGIAALIGPVHQGLAGGPVPLEILSGSAANMAIEDKSVDLVCMDPPYYNNVQYAELSDFFYVWQKRTLSDLYPGLFRWVMTNKEDEAVANPVRHKSDAGAHTEYETRMSEIFRECRRVLKDDGLMTLMFTHKTQKAWESITRSLIENGWVITSSMPVESESAASTHQKNKASAASSVFLSCRKRDSKQDTTTVWLGFGGTGVAARVRDEVITGLDEMEHLGLNAVDEMVASYGRALKVLSENWPVLDGDELVSPIRAMNEASPIVAEHQLSRASKGRIKVRDLKSEAAMALIAFSIFGNHEFAYDEALNLSRALSLRFENKAQNYTVSANSVGYNAYVSGARSGRRASSEHSIVGYAAPFVLRGSKIRLALPEERDERRMENPQTEWDLLHGIIRAYREGDIPVVRAYLDNHADGGADLLVEMLKVWSEGAGRENLVREAKQILYGLQ